MTSRNMVGDFDSVDEVLDTLSRAYDEVGIKVTNDYMLLEVDGDSDSIYVEGKELVVLIQTHKHAISR
jgi:hypothetical protein